MDQGNPNPTFDALAGLFGLAAAKPAPSSFEPFSVRDRVYRDVQIRLDGYSFSNCAFVNCLLATSKGSFHLDHCFVHLCRAQLTGGSARALKLASLFAASSAQFPEDLRALINPDGSVTIP